MDRIEFVIAEQELGVGVVEECAEPVINGESLVDILKRAERAPSGYAGLPPEGLLSALRRPERAADVQVLRCICGDDACSWARVDVENGPDEVVWRNVRASRADASVYASVGPYRFSAKAYERALAEPTHSDAPVRDGAP
jgi:hypothetical protein